MTGFELWHHKKNADIIELEPSDRMKWGTRFESVIALGVAEDFNLKVRPMKEYIRDPVHRIGSSFDYAIDEDGILEIKNVDSLQFDKGWLVEDDDVQAPPHIEMQVQHQLAVSGRKYAKIAAMIGGNRVVLLDRERDEEVIGAIRHQADLFWSTIAKNQEPKPDFERDAKFIASLYKTATAGRIALVENNLRIKELALDYKAYVEAEKEAKAGKDACKAEILTMINDAEKAIGEGFTISAGMTAPAIIERYERAGYRNFKLTWRKQK